MRPKKTTGKYGVESLPYYNGYLNYVDLVEYLEQSSNHKPCYSNDTLPEGHDFRIYTLNDIYESMIASAGPVYQDMNIGAYQFGLYSRDKGSIKQVVSIKGKVEKKYGVGLYGTGLYGTTVMNIIFSNRDGGSKPRDFLSTFYEYRYLVRSNEGEWVWQYPSVDHTNLIEMANKLREIL